MKTSNQCFTQQVGGVQPSRCASLFQFRQARKFAALIVSLFLLSSSVANLVHASAGDLDPSFGSGGKVTTDFFGAFDGIEALVVQPDGKIVAAGTTVNAGQGDFALARYNPDGSLDSTFGTGGKVNSDLFGSGLNEAAHSIAIQTDGRIVAAGDFHTDFQNSDFVLARYNADGSLDSTFGSGGKVTTSLGFHDSATDIAIQQDSKIIVSGFSESAGLLDDFVVIRYNFDGILDPTFGVNGIVITDFSGGEDIARAIVIQGDNRIVVAGGSDVSNNLDTDFALARYNSDGSLDSTFGIGGKVTTDFFGGDDTGSDTALQTDGRIVVAGQVLTQAGDQTTLDFGLARYNSDGSLDSSFGSVGKTTTDFLGQADFASAVTIQSNGRIVAAGTSTIAGAPFTDFALTRYDANGSLDPSFGAGGKVRTDFFGQFDFAFDVVIQADGRIVAGGRADSIVGGVVQSNFALARYLGDLSLPFNACLQDEDTGDTLQFNSTTGDYLFTHCGARGFTLNGTGVVRNHGCSVALEDAHADRKVEATVNTCHDKGKASVKAFTLGATFKIKDNDTSNNTCLCR